MDNSYFVYTTPGESLNIERFHICTWEFSNNSNLVEFGCEITSESVANKNVIEIKLFIPWLTINATITDFYTRLREPSNSRFIFNDSISNVASLDGGENQNGVIHKFSGKDKLCILPIEFINDFENHKVTVRLNLNIYHQFEHPLGEPRPNIYFRFCIKPKKSEISVTKKGITKSTILYDIKLNQRRNIPDGLLNEILQHELCNVKTCFCFNIIPNTHDLVFFDSATLKNVRTLEYGAFKKYLGNDLLQEEGLIVVFNKKSELDSYSFFSIFTKEHIGIDQLAVALFINLVAGVLLFIASLEVSLALENRKFSSISLPLSFWLVVILFLAMLCYFLKKRFDFSFKIKKKNK
jgi:hypothetical protein